MNLSAPSDVPAARPAAPRDAAPSAGTGEPPASVLSPAASAPGGGSGAVPAARRAVGAVSPRAAAWRSSVAALGFALVVLLAAFAETVETTVHTWWSAASYNHGLIVVPVVLFLIWDRRADLARLVPRATLWGLPLVAGSSLLWTVGDVVHAVVVQQFGLIGMIWGVVLTVLGPSATWGMAFPLGFLLFAVPFGDFLVVHLQDLTAEMTVSLLRASGVPVFSDGVVLSTSFGQFEVAEACARSAFPDGLRRLRHAVC